jgi:hypothetical protein
MTTILLAINLWCFQNQEVFQTAIDDPRTAQLRCEYYFHVCEHQDGFKVCLDSMEQLKKRYEEGLE